MLYASFEQKHYNMAKSARSLAFAAIISALLQLPFLPFILGGLAVTFAILSKGNTAELSISAKIAIVLGLLSMIISVMFFSITLYKILTTPEELATLNNMCMQLYGISWTDMLSDMKESYLQ